MFQHTLVARKRLEFIAYNYLVSSHARDRLKERRAVYTTLKESILKSPLAWRCPNGTIKIAFNKTEYIVVSDTTGTHNMPTIITFISLDNRTVIDEFVTDYENLKEED